MKLINISVTILIICVVASQSALVEETTKRTAVFNQQWLKTLVSIELLKKESKGKPIGSGFLVGTPKNHIALVTAKHVVQEDKGNGRLRTGLAFRLNDKEGKSVLLSDDHATKVLKSGWLRSKTNDLSCRLIVQRETTDYVTIPYSLFLPTKQIQAGAPLFIIGFPLGLRSEAYATPIVRRAIVARSDAVVIIVDGFVYPGNSGGPVIYEPSVQLGPSFSTPILQGDWLVGMVLSEISYVEPAISVHTGRPRITFEDNSGLCNVLPAELILELLSSKEFSKLDASVK